MKKRSPESTLRQRVEENKEKSQNSRFKIVNYTRALDTSTDETVENKNLTIVDVEKERIQEQFPTTSTSAATASTSTSQEPYVYDLYVSENNNTVLHYPENIDDLRLVLVDDIDLLFSHYYYYI